MSTQFIEHMLVGWGRWNLSLISLITERLLCTASSSDSHPMPWSPLKQTKSIVAPKPGEGSVQEDDAPIFSSLAVRSTGGGRGMSVRDPANGRVESMPPTQPPPWASFPSLPRLSPSFLHTPTGIGGWFSPLAWVGWNLGNYSFSRKLLVWASGDHCVCVCVCVCMKLRGRQQGG